MALQDAVSEASRMKWFTREWARGELSEQEADAQLEAFHLSSADLAASTSGVISALAGRRDPRLDLSDGVIDSVEHDPAHGRITLQIVQGNLQDGYGLLTLEAKGAQLESPSVGELEKIVQNPKTEVWYWEFDRGQHRNRFELRLLLWPSGEAAVSFRDLAYTWTPRQSRDVPAARRRVALTPTATRTDPRSEP